MGVEVFSSRCTARCGVGQGRLVSGLLALLFAVGCHSEPTLDEIVVLQMDGRFAETLEMLRARIDDGRAGPDVLYHYGVALSRTGNITQALWPLREAARDPDWFSRAQMEITAGAYRTGNYDFAVEQLGVMIEREPDNAGALRMRGMSRLHTRRDYEGALADFDLAVVLEPDGVDMSVARIVALLGLERIDEAGEALEALASDPNDSEEAGADAAVYGKQFEVLACAASAKFAEEKGEFETARERYTGCLEDYPAASLVIKEALDFFQKHGEAERSEDILRAAYEQAPEDRSIRIAWARTRQLQGHIDEAEAVLREAAQAMRPGAWLDLGGFLRDEGKLDEALEVYEQGVELGASTPDFKFAYAEALLQAERFEDALALADAIEVASYASLIRGRVALDQGRAAEALAHFGEGTLLWPDNAVARYYTARAAEQMGDFDRAIEEYRYAIRVEANATDARHRIARIHLAENSPDAALYMIRYQGIRSEKAEKDWELLMLEVEALGQSAKSGQGVSRELARGGVGATLRELRLGQPVLWGRAVAALARGAYRRGGAEASAAAVRGADRLDLEQAAGAPALRILVDNLAELGEAEEGLALAARAARNDPEAPELLEILAEALWLAGQPGEAQARFDALLAADPENRQALLGRARVQLALGEVDAARAALERAQQVEPEDSTDLREEASLLVALGRPEEAQARLQAALALEPYDGAAALALARLRAEAGAPEAEVTALKRRAARFGTEAGSG